MAMVSIQTHATLAMAVTTSQLAQWATLALATIRVAAATNLVVALRATSLALLSTRPSTTRATLAMAVTASTVQDIIMAGTQLQVCCAIKVYTQVVSACVGLHWSVALLSAVLTCHSCVQLKPVRGSVLSLIYLFLPHCNVLAMLLPM